MSMYDDGESSQVEGMSYCMKKGFNARNTDEMTNKLGYHSMADLANTPKAPTSMMGAKANDQVGPKAADVSKNDRKGKAY